MKSDPAVDLSRKINQWKAAVKLLFLATIGSLFTF